VRALARLGRDILADEGRSVSDAIVERIARTLDAAALDEASRFLLRAGRLTEELDPPGFEALAGLAPPPGSPQKRTAADKPRREAVGAARRRVQEAQREVRTRTREAVQAERDVERAESAAEEARRAAQAARERSEEAERSLAEAEAALRDAQRR
jgi:hypothetical protein